MKPIQQYLDYTLLRLGATVSEVYQLCDEAVEQRCYAVCVPPCYVPGLKERLMPGDVKLCSVVGFPHGMHLTSIKVTEARTLLDIGADELDMVVNLGRFRSGDYRYTQAEIESFVQQCQRRNAVSKVIIESGLLSFEEVDRFCEICAEAGADFVKTSTGFAGVGAELDKVARMREVLPPHMQIKASGGIKSLESAKAFIAAGATRIGASTLFTES
ncbi:MAG: deoxyribose-phosphate aldolase [Bacteroidia bacterium]|nr:deoxyribose-phosphate aldolase [Bacteroidia bacterium]